MVLSLQIDFKYSRQWITIKGILYSTNIEKNRTVKNWIEGIIEKNRTVKNWIEGIIDCELCDGIFVETYCWNDNHCFYVLHILNFSHIFGFKTGIIPMYQGVIAMFNYNNNRFCESNADMLGSKLTRNLQSSAKTIYCTFTQHRLISFSK